MGRSEGANKDNGKPMRVNVDHETTSTDEESGFASVWSVDRSVSPCKVLRRRAPFCKSLLYVDCSSILSRL